jgi:hypothetical protein
MINGPHAVATFPEGITASDEIVGSYFDSTGAQKGFVRKRNREFVTLTVPHSSSTDAKAINSHGTITGNYVRGNGNPHGFVLAGNCDECD